MAKQPILTINVNSQQFQQFAQQFDVVAGQIKQFNSQFQQINVSLQKSNIMVRGVQASMQGLLSITKSVGSEVFKITKSFVSWGTIIGGVTALLGMGGGLFGIERLAASIMQKRRMTLGLGQDYGRTQASMIFSQGLIGSPGDVMKNIRLGQAGAPGQQTALLAMGINPFGGAKMTPDETMDKIVEKLPNILNRAGPGNVLRMAQAYGLDKIFTDPMDLLRLSTEEGRKEYQLKRELTKKYEDLMKITPKAQAAWTELELQFQAAKAQMESVFGEKLADLASPLKHLSDAFATFIRILMNTPIVKEIIDHFAKWIEELATKMEHLTKDDIQAFIDEIKKWVPDMETFKSTMTAFVEILQGAVEVLKFLRHPVDYFKQNLLPRAYESAEGATPPGTSHGVTVTPAGKAIWNKIHNLLTNPLGSTPKTPASPGGGIGPFQFGGGNFIGPNPQRAVSSSGGDTSQFGPASTIWSGAAAKMVPQAGGGGVTGAGGSFGRWQEMQKSGGGPLSLNNWQMNRTASLVVRNVPGANIFMTAAGMTG